MERQNMGMEDVNTNTKPVFSSSSSPPPSPSRSSSKNLSFKEKQSIKMMDEIKNSSQPYPSLTPTSNKLSFSKKDNNDKLHIGPATISTPTKLKGISEDDFTTPSTPFVSGGGGGGGEDYNEIDNDMDVETETENENKNENEKTHRQKQLAKNH
jgi:hypothetical protein